MKQWIKQLIRYYRFRISPSPVKVVSKKDGHVLPYHSLFFSKESLWYITKERRYFFPVTKMVPLQRESVIVYAFTGSYDSNYEPIYADNPHIHYDNLEWRIDGQSFNESSYLLLEKEKGAMKNESVLSK